MISCRTLAKLTAARKATGAATAARASTLVFGLAAHKAAAVLAVRLHRVVLLARLHRQARLAVHHLQALAALRAVQVQAAMAFKTGAPALSIPKAMKLSKMA